MPHEFVILVNGKLETYTRYEDIPEEFDNVIKFLPEVPDDILKNNMKKLKVGIINFKN